MKCPKCGKIMKIAGSEPYAFADGVKIYWICESCKISKPEPYNVYYD